MTFTELYGFRYVHHVSPCKQKMLFSFTEHVRKHFRCNSFNSSVDSASCTIQISDSFGVDSVHTQKRKVQDG
jgi:hypothetical protein